MNTICFGLSRCAGLSLVIAVLSVFSVAAVARGQDLKKPQGPAFQYELDDIRISIPSADEPRVKAFDAESLQAAARYLEVGAVSWVRGRSCVNCHTTGPYMTEYTGANSGAAQTQPGDF